MGAIRKIIEIDESLCDGCGLCVPSCHESAIELVDTPQGKKARLVKEIYCDGLGDCLGACPTGAIKIEEREADAYDEKATQEHMKSQVDQKPKEEPLPKGCPSMNMLRWETPEPVEEKIADNETSMPAQLQQWPVQLHLISPLAPYFKNAELVVIADCVALAYGNLQNDLIKDKAVVMACPKFDDTSTYVEKLAELIAFNDLKSIKVAYMVVPCCRSMVMIVQQAMAMAKSDLNLELMQIGIKGEILQ